MQIAALLAEARHALSLGDRAKAKQFASQALRLDSKHIETWLLLAELVEAPEQKRDCFQRILVIDPTNAHAKQALNQLDAPAPVAAASFELPKSAWFGSKSAEPELTAQVGGGLIATPSLSTSSSSGIRPLAQTQTPSLVELSNTPAMPTGYVQPIQPSYNQPNYPQTNQAYSLPAASYGQTQPQYGQVTYPHVEPSYNAMLLKSLVFTVIGLFMFCFVVNAFVDLSKEPPPTPKVSAQDRTTAMLDDLSRLVVNPDLYNDKTAKQLSQSFVEKYYMNANSKETEIFITEIYNEWLNQGAKKEDLAISVLPGLKHSYVTPVTYKVLNQSNQRITLKLLSGDIVYTFHNNRFITVPLNESYDRFTLVNLDGVWYISDVQIIE